MNTLSAFLITFLAGFSTLLGFCFVFIKDNRGVVLKNCLGFAAGVMLCVSIVSLIPESLILLYKGSKTDSFIMSGFFIMVGLILSYLLDKLIPEKNNLYKVGIFSMLALTLHNIPEGVVTFLSSSSNLTLGIMLAIALALHNIPEGVSIAVPIFKASKNIKKAFLYTLIAGISEPFGALLAFIFLKSFVNNTILGILFAIIAGIMIHISFLKLLSIAFEYKNRAETFLFFVLGILIMYISHLIIN